MLAILLAIREESCPIRLLDLSCNFDFAFMNFFFYDFSFIHSFIHSFIGNAIGDEGAKYLINFLNGKSNVQLAVLLLHRKDSFRS